MTDEKSFRLEEATIDELHEAIKNGKTTCVAIVCRNVRSWVMNTTVPSNRLI